MQSTTQEPTEFETVAGVIRRRCTTKVLASDHSPPPVTSESMLRQVQQCIAAAGWAPFHYDRSHEGIAEPWRVHWMAQPHCHQLASRLPEIIHDLKPNNKFAGLLRATHCLIAVTWLPIDANAFENPAKGQETNNEHLAATAAYVQNLLLLLEACGMGSYWSSGELIKSTGLKQELSIPAGERLLAAVFVDAGRENQNRQVDVVPGTQRAKRSGVERWSRAIPWPQAT